MAQSMDTSSKQYALSTEGRRHLFERLNAFSTEDARSEEAFNLRVGLFPGLDAHSRESILELRETYLQGRGEKLAALQGNMDLGKFGGEVVRHMRNQIGVELEWIRRLRRITKSMVATPARARTVLSR